MKKVILISVIVVAATACLVFLYVSTRPKGYISIDVAGAEMQLAGGRFSGVEVRSSKGPARVTVGTYSPQNLAIQMKQDGDTWGIESSGPWGTLAQVKVQKDQTTALKLGPPLLVKPEVRRGSPQQVSVGLTIFGQAGEKYRNVITKNGEPISPPKVKIVDEAGTVIASGRFEYG